MPTLTLQASSNESADSTQGGAAVTSPSNTGHGSTTSSDAPGAGAAIKTCRWSGFAASGQQTGVRLQFSWAITSGSLGSDGNNSFTIQYSTDSGSNWTTAVSRADQISADSGNEDIELSASQDISQVQVRDNLTAIAGTVGLANITASVSGIQLAVTTAAPQLLVMW